MLKIIHCAALAAILVPGAAFAQDFDAGLDAHNAGDYEVALQEWRPLAEEGHMRAQYGIGHMYFEGEGLVQDYAEAARWIRRAAEQGHMRAQISLGSMYFEGTGVPEDGAEGMRWSRKAAKQGHAEAQLLLGLAYGVGEDLPQDFVASHMWLNIAATNEDSRAARKREMLSENMSAEDVSEAQQRARVCVESDYQNCD